MDDIRDCFRILDLEPGASFEDVKRSYRELVRVWHPDRFRSDPKLQAKAEEKLKQINLAYERLCKEAAAEGSHKAAATKTKAATNPAPERTRPEDEATHVPPVKDPSSPNEPENVHLTRWIWVATAVVALLIIAVTRSEKARESSDSARVQLTTPPKQVPKPPHPREELKSLALEAEQFFASDDWKNADTPTRRKYLDRSAEVFDDAFANAEPSLEVSEADSFYNSTTAFLKGKMAEHNRMDSEAKSRRAKSFEWYQKTASAGDRSAQTALGVMYEHGQGVSKDDNKAAEWFQKAAEQGDAVAQRSLGEMYAEGRGVHQDEAKAVEWFRKAATQGDSSAQRSIGQMYAEGRGVRKDEAKAEEWFQKSEPPEKPMEKIFSKMPSVNSATIDIIQTTNNRSTFKIAPAQVNVKVNAKTFLEAKTEASQQSQRLATAKYPDLKNEASSFHAKFTELYGAAKSDGNGLLDDPNWPMVVADMAATALRAYDTLNFGDSKEAVIGKLKQSTKLKPYDTESIRAKPDEIDGAYYLDVNGEAFKAYFTFYKSELAEVAFCSPPADIFAYNGRVEVAWKAIRDLAVLRFGEPAKSWGFPDSLKVMRAQGAQFLSDKWDIDGKEVTVGVSCGKHTYNPQLTVSDKARKGAIKKAAAGGL